jgi:hypothetical protein
MSVVTIEFASWAQLSIALVQGQPRVEVQYLVGPIPIYNFEAGSSYLQVWPGTPLHGF